MDPRIQTKIDEKLSEFLNNAGAAIIENDLQKVSDFIVHRDTWEEVSSRFKTISILNKLFTEKEWNFETIKKTSLKSTLLSGSVGLSINVSEFFKHPAALDCLKELLNSEEPPVSEAISNWIINATEIAFFDKDTKPNLSEAALFASVLLAARYPEHFVDFRQNRWKSVVEFIGLDGFQGNYGEKLIYAGQIAKAISQSRIYQQYFPT